MIIYNVTIKVDRSIAGEWLHWLKDEHIPEMYQSGCFVKHQVVKLLDADDEESETYAVQYYADTKDQLDIYLEKHAGKLRQKGFERWGNRFVAFRTVMEVIN